MFLLQENCTGILDAFSFRSVSENLLYVMYKKKKPLESRCALKIFGNSVRCPQFQLSLDSFCQVLITSQMVYIRRQSDAQLSRSNAREICAFSRCRVIAVKITSSCYIISPVSYILRVCFVGRVRLKPRKKMKHVLAPQIIESWANHDPLSRSRLYILYFSLLCLLVVDLYWILSKAFVFFLHVSRERLL